MLVALLALTGCGFMDSESEAANSSAPGGRQRSSGEVGRGGRGGPGFGAGSSATTAIPIQVTPVERRVIAQYLETNGSLEAENDVDLVARTSGPIVELAVEEGMQVRRGQLLARIDAEEVKARLRMASVSLEEAQLSFGRAKVQFDNEILSRELFDQARSGRDSAQAAIEEAQVQLSYTDILAPFSGVIAVRYIKFAEHVQNGTPLFRISDFNPLQCPIQVPEKDLARLVVGQPAYLTVEAFGEEKFTAKVLRVSPVVDSATGTVKVTLEVSTRGKLRPGMFASVFLETDRRQEALVIPKSALVLESIGDTLYIRAGEVAERRAVRLGYDEGDFVEIIEGVAEGDEVIVLGQDSLSDGTPVYVLADRASPGTMPSGGATAEGASVAPRSAGAGGPSGAVAEEPADNGQARGAAGPAASRRGPPAGFDPSNPSPEMLETIKQRMRSRGLSEEQIEQRLERMKNGEFPGPRGAPRQPPG